MAQEAPRVIQKNPSAPRIVVDIHANCYKLPHPRVVRSHFSNMSELDTVRECQMRHPPLQDELFQRGIDQNGGLGIDAFHLDWWKYAHHRGEQHYRLYRHWRSSQSRNGNCQSRYIHRQEACRCQTSQFQIGRLRYQHHVDDLRRIRSPLKIE